MRWHQGRCLSYGDGVAYWALAEMVRARAGIAEEEAPRPRAPSSATPWRQCVTDERERQLVEPRLAHLLGLEQRTAPDRADLFSGWRLFFERMSETRRWCSCSRTSNGPTPGCWSSSTTCSSGPPITRCSCSHWDARGCSDRGPHGRTRRSRCDRSRTRRCAQLLEGLVPGLPRGARRAGARARRGGAAVRGRDRADAARPRPPDPGGQPLPSGWRRRRTRRPRDAARARRRSPGRSHAERAGDAAGRVGVRTIVYAGRHRGAVGPSA